MIRTSVTLNLRTAEGLARAKEAILASITDVFENDITPTAKALAPVLKEKTSERYPGELRDSIDFKVTVAEKGVNAEVFTECGYGGYVEVGTKKMAAEPYIYPAYERNIGKLPELVKEKLSESE